MPNISSSLREAQEAEFGRLLIREIPAMHITVSRRLGDSLETSEEEWAETKGAYEKVKDSYRKMLEQIDEMGCRTAGDGYEEYLVAESASDNDEDYVTRIMIPVKIGTRK